MNIQLTKRIGALVAAVGLAGAASVMATAPAQAASGRVSCEGAPVVGMWIDVDGGTDGWAVLTYVDGSVMDYSYNTQGRSWRAFVGCGGTPQNWGSSTETNRVSGQAVTVTCVKPYGYYTCYAG